VSSIAGLLQSRDLTPPLEAEAARGLAQTLAAATGWAPYPHSIVGAGRVLYFLGRRDLEKRLCLLWERPASLQPLGDIHGDQTSVEANGLRLKLQAGPLDHTNAEGLRKHLPFTAPRLLGVEATIGCGDRLGLATPAHVRAVRGTGLRAVFAQQSIREMTRTGRTPEEAMDTATFGVFQEGWREGFGADADHLKTPEDVDATVAAGFTMFTIDPGDHVDGEAERADLGTVRARFDQLPWSALESPPDRLLAAFADPVHLPDGTTAAFTEETVLRAAVKYGRALAHTAGMYRHLCGRMAGRPFELEVSVDETAVPTSVGEHVFLARELARLGVSWVSLAPRFVGDFEKGVDYRGDLDEFTRSFAQHVAVATLFGPYKIGIHSASDKFSIYPIAARLAEGLVHVKTAGTSYLEALRALARVEPALFREIARFAIERYPSDRASYHVSADPARVPQPEALSDDQLPGLLDQFDSRQVLHVTFGSVLTALSEGRPRFRDRILRALAEHEEIHYQTVAAHIARHLRPLSQAQSG